MAAVALTTPILEQRSNTVLVITTYTGPICTGSGAAGSSRYFTPDGPCLNVPPIPNEPLVPFTSFTAGYMPVASGITCDLQVFANANCGGQHEGFTSDNIFCQNVGVELANEVATGGATGNLPLPKVGARSVRLECTRS